MSTFAPALGLSIALLLPWSAQAESGFSGEAAIVSDYVDRGISNSDNDPAVQAGLSWQHDSGLYAGLWGSSVDFNDGDEATVELDYFAGYAGEFASINYDVSVAYVSFPGSASSLDYDLWEFGFAAARDLGPLTLGGEAIYTPENAGKAGEALYLRGIVELPVADAISLSAHLGHQWITDEDVAGPDYLDWGFGIAWSAGSLEFGATYTDTDLGRACERLCDSRFVVYAAMSLP